ncbi:MAG: polyprenyl synthetase family protein [Clostridia bacterium]|nr:polyprenyl synthetase family protein [Clostridia bacterium]
MTFKEGLHNKAVDIEKALDRFFVSDKTKFDQQIIEAMHYSIASGGKRIRPILLMEIGKLYGVKESDLMPFACAIEMIHTYSLIHDDLPAMDNDDYRRGRLTNHKVHGEAMAILAGDGLLNYAYEIMAQTAFEKQEPKYVRAMFEVAKAAGHKGMIVGQVADMVSEDQEGDKTTLSFIHENKTGQLLTVPMLVGGILGNAEENQIKLLKTLGHHIGLMFQIKDDLLDIESTQEVLGKPIGSDEKNNKLTYPSLYGVQASYDLLETLKSEAIVIVESLPGDKIFLKDLIDFLVYRNN